MRLLPAIVVLALLTLLACGQSSRSCDDAIITNVDHYLACAESLSPCHHDASLAYHYEIRDGAVHDSALEVAEAFLEGCERNRAKCGDNYELLPGGDCRPLPPDSN